jgi:hypothetical protein
MNVVVCVCVLLVRIFLVAAFRVLVGAPGNLGFVESGKDWSEMCLIISRCWFLAVS